MKTTLSVFFAALFLCPLVNHIQAQTLTADILQGDTLHVCEGESIPLDGNPSGGTAPYNHLWTGDAGQLSSTNSQTPNFVAGSTVTLIYTVTDDIANTASDTIVIIVNLLPTAFVPSGYSVCDYTWVESILFTSIPAGATYTWTNSNPAIGLPPSGTGPIPGFTATNPGMSPLYATIAVTPTINGCTGLPSSFTIIVSPMLFVNATATPDTICFGSISVLTATGGSTYMWSPAVGLSTNIGVTVIASPATSSTYTVTAADGFGCSSSGIVNVTVVTCPDTITGKVFYDTNNDGIMNVGEQGAANMMLKIMPDNMYAYTQADGRYQTSATMSAHTITLAGQPFFTNISPVSQNANFTASGQIDSLNDFALYTLPNVKELEVTLTGTNTPNPITGAFFIINYRNNGTDTLNGTIKLVCDTLLNYTFGSPVASSVAGDTITWNVPDIFPHTSGMIQAHFQVPPATVLGTSLSSSVIILPIAGDTIPQNNLDTLNQIVAASYDPNDKSVVPSDPLTPEEVLNAGPLTYTIRFQNTGTAPAANIVVKDTLSHLLNIETLEMVASSHSYSVQIDESNTLQWTFSNINLPDSNTNEALSHGFIKYRIKPLTTLSEDDTLKNTAYIYFDYNAPVATNTVVSYLADVTISVSEAKKSDLVKIYPNPAVDEFIIEHNLPGESTFELYDILGAKRMMVNLNSGSGTEKINATGLGTGLYIFSIVDQNGQWIKTGKLMVAGK